MSVEHVQIVLPSNPEDRKKLKSSLKEYSNNLTIASSYKLANDEILTNLKEEYNIPKPILKKLGDMYYKDDRDKIVSQINQLDEAFDRIFSVE